MNHRTQLAGGFLIGAAIIAVSLAGAVWAARGLALDEEFLVAQRLAEQVLQRNEKITVQVHVALDQLDAARFTDPCSEAARTLMARVAMRSSLLQAVVFLKGNQVACGSLDLRGLDLGPRDFISSLGTAVRTSRRLPMIDQDSRFRITQSLTSGYAAVVNTDLAFDSLGDLGGAQVGIVGSRSGQVISSIGEWQPRWSGHFRTDRSVVFSDGQVVVALQPSTRYEYFAYAALSTEQLQLAWRRAAWIVIPLSLLASGLMAALIMLGFRRQMGLPALLRLALRKEGELFLLYQPFVDLDTGRWVGAEALMRWRRPDGEFISPDVFIPIAESHGLMAPLTAKLLQMVRRDLDRLLHEHPDFFVSVNIAAEDLMDEGFADRMGRFVREWGVQPLQLRLEATERTLIDPQAAAAAIQRIRDQGLRIALDDFGTGYSSLAYLTTLKVDSIKIDKAFVETIGTEAVTAEVVAHIIELGRSLNLRMIGEGIETADQAAYLRAHGVHFGQGWHFARPMDAGLLAQGLRAGSPASGAAGRLSPA